MYNLKIALHILKIGKLSWECTNSCKITIRSALGAWSQYCIFTIYEPLNVSVFTLVSTSLIQEKCYKIIRTLKMTRKTPFTFGSCKKSFCLYGLMLCNISRLCNNYYVYAVSRKLAAIFWYWNCTTQSGDCAKQNHSIKAFCFGHFTQYKVSTMKNYSTQSKSQWLGNKHNKLSSTNWYISC